MTGLKKSNCVHEEMSFDAEWWLPSDASNRFRGTLTGSVANGFRLSIEGAFFLSEKDLSEIPVILGESRKGKKYTLLKNYSSNGSRTINLIDPTSITRNDSTYLVSWLIAGEHCNSYDDTLFYSISFGISNLEEWHLAKSFDVEYHEENDDPIAGFSVTYKHPKPVIIISDEYINATIEYSYSHSGINLPQTSYSINQRATIIIRAVDSPLRLHDFEDKNDVTFSKYMRKIVSFIEFATQERVYEFDIHLCSKENPYGSLQSIIEPVAVYYKTNVSHELAKPVRTYDMLFNWKHIEQHPQKHFQAWVEKIDLIGMPIWLYLASLHENKYQEQIFMELTQGLEGFHRYRFPDPSEPTEEHQSKVESIIAGCPEEYQKWLAGKLKHSHEPNLQSRLKELFNEQVELFTWLANSKKNKNEVKELIVKIRNHQAHCLSASSDVVSLNLRFNINRYMQFVLATLFLKEINFSDEQIENIIKNNWTGQQIPRVLSKALSSNKTKETAT